MKPLTEIELKFRVPAAQRAALVAEMARGHCESLSLAAIYLDTPDRRLARAGIAWRLRREGRRWVQTLKGAVAGSLARFEHEVERPAASRDASLHAGTEVGDRLIAILDAARAEGIEPEVRFRTEVRRSARRLRSGGAVIEVALDEGRLVAGDASARILEVEFELVSGPPAALLALAERWRRRHALTYDPCTKAERGDRLAGGAAHPAPRRAKRLRYAADATAQQAWQAVVDECLDQITRNAAALCDGDPALRVEHVHQLRVGIRRLRSALRCFDGWVDAVPDALVEGLRELFATLGRARDIDVLGSGVVAELLRAGAPPPRLPPVDAGSDPVAALRADAAQRLLLAWVAWR
ncbi:MAG: inorganic triphosphatase, partial [Burkholderiales bacterium]|nr:inorganic triphosphatase [Burkholderiales bacterium]